jgi:hypothetical protein
MTGRHRGGRSLWWLGWLLLVAAGAGGGLLLALVAILTHQGQW